MRKVFRSRRRVVVAVVAALAVVGIGSSTASAVTAPGSVGTCNGVAYSSTELLLACLVSLSKSVDVQPKDMKVAAPSSVIKATSSGNTAADVSRWRPNTPAWTQETTKLVGNTSVTTADIADTGRWQPKLLKAAKIGGGAASIIAGDTLVTWIVRDGVMYPVLEAAGVEDARGTVEDTYCVRHGNIATDWLGGWVGADCAEWRLPQDYAALVNMQWMSGEKVCVGSSCNQLMAATQFGSNGLYFCVWGVGPAVALAVGDLQLRVVSSPTPDQQPQTRLNGGLMGSASGQFNGTGACAGDALRWYKQGNWGWGASTVLHEATWVNAAGEKVADGLTMDGGDAEWITRVRCTDGSARVSVSEAFQQEAYGEIVAPNSVTMSGCVPVKVDVGIQNAGKGTTGAETGEWSPAPDPTAPPSSDPKPDRVQVGGAEVPEPVRDWQVNYPSCWDGSCRLILKKVVGAGELDCFDVPDQCIDWFDETKTSPSTYRCYYAGQLVPLSECNVYARVFDREKVQQGTGYADPETGEEQKTGTGTTVTTNPGAAKVAMEKPVQDASQSRECWPTGWGVFNPFEWVMKPVQCALEWAFVPRTSKVTQLQANIRMAAVNSKPAQIIAGVESWGSVVPAADGCMGPALDFNIAGFSYSGYPLQACSGPLATAAYWSRIALSCIIVITGLVAITRYVGRIFGYGGVGENGGSA